jgi:hypothetical protein
MNKSDFEKCCRNVEHGAEVFVENAIDHKTGRVLYCITDRFYVDLDGKRDAWLPQICETSSTIPH